MASEKRYKAIPELTDSDYIRFWSKATLTANPEKCWEWQAGVEKSGYGVISINGIDYKAHRVSYFLSRNENPTNRLVCHTCDNRICVNPDHLYVGTHQDNIDDMIRKGRHVVSYGCKNGTKTHPELTPRGSRAGAAKLTEKEVIEIRRIWKSKESSLRKMAVSFKVSKATIERVVYRKQWKHL